MRRARPAWARWLAGRGVVALEEVDTRALVRRLRANGAMRCASSALRRSRNCTPARWPSRTSITSMLEEPGLGLAPPSSTPV